MLGPGFYNMDCMEGMKEFPDGYFHLAIVDPPYGIQADTFKNGAGASKYKGAEWGTETRVKRNRTGEDSTANRIRKQRAEGRLNHGCGTLKGRMLNQADCSWDCEIPPEEYFRELRRVSQNQIIWGGNYFPLPPTRCVIVWDKVQPWENFSQVEIAWTSFDKPASLFRMNNCYSGKIHPTQKPVQLYCWLLDKYAKEGDRILDTHVGSASSLVACQRMGFEYTGFEIDEFYYREAAARLEKEKNQINVFELLQEMAD